MTSRKATSSMTRALSPDELSGIAGGQQVYSHEFPASPTRSFQPVFGPPLSIAQGEINENSTDDNLP